MKKPRCLHPGEQPCRSVLLKVEYDGTRYHGWQRQPNAKTVEESILAALGTVFGTDIPIRACSRTDAGVHARGQIAQIRIPETFPLNRLFFSLNSLLPKDISILDMIEVDLDFLIGREHCGKLYVYRINNSPIPKAIHGEYYWWIKKRLDIASMRESAQFLVGTHDFSAFRGKGCTQHKLIKTIRQIRVSESCRSVYRHIEFSVEGSGFLKNMIRIMVGTCIDIACGRLKSDAIEKALKSGLRSDAGQTAPAKGLMLEQVFLKNDPFLERTREAWNKPLS